MAQPGSCSLSLVPPPAGPSRRRTWTLSPQDFPKWTNPSRPLPHLQPPAEAALLDGTAVTPHQPPLPRPRLGHRRHVPNAAASPGSPPRQRPGFFSPSVFSSESHPGHGHPGFPCVSHSRFPPRESHPGLFGSTVKALPSSPLKPLASRELELAPHAPCPQQGQVPSSTGEMSSLARHIHTDTEASIR